MLHASQPLGSVTTFPWKARASTMPEAMSASSMPARMIHANQMPFSQVCSADMRLSRNVTVGERSIIPTSMMKTNPSANSGYVRGAGKNYNAFWGDLHLWILNDDLDIKWITKRIALRVMRLPGTLVSAWFSGRSEVDLDGQFRAAACREERLLLCSHL